MEPMLAGRKLETILKDIDERFKLEPEAERMIMDMAEDFIERVATPACLLAKHRGSTTLEVKDLQLVLEKQEGIKVPGGPPSRPYKPPTYVRPPHPLMPITGKKKQKKKQASSSMASKADGSSDNTSGINSGDGVKSTESIEALTGINPKGKKRQRT